MAATQPVSPDTLIAVKVAYQGTSRRFKLPLKELTPTALPAKVRENINVPESVSIVLERYSDSAAGYVTLDPSNVQVYKTLVRAAKAKLKLRLRANVSSPMSQFISSPEVTAAMHDLSQYSSNVPTFPTGLNSSLRTSATSFVAPSATSQATLGNKSSSATLVNPKPELPAQPATRGGNKSPQALGRQEFLAKMVNAAHERELALRTKEPPAPMPFNSWSVYCNNCDKPMSNEHYHCSVCDNGDYDLCEGCVESGAHCPGEGHWLIRRVVKNGKVINSLTQTIPPKEKGKAKVQKASRVSTEPSKEMPGAFTTEEKVAGPEPQDKNNVTSVVEPAESTRICNNCIDEFPDANFVTCKDCPDFDLCVQCHVENDHGHHPGHSFAPVSESVSQKATDLCAENRGIRHAAICDGCDKTIYGVRHKCLNCPDWDYCSNCIKNSKFIHPNHRFVPVYERLGDPSPFKARHVGIYCDGPLCKVTPSNGGPNYIQGVRYKCAVCHDTDFCATCEASPSNSHNRTHPLIMFKTPVRNVSVTTLNEDKNSQRLLTLGDRRLRSAFAPAVAPPATGPSNNSTAQVQTVANLEPSPRRSLRNKEKIAIKDLLSEPINEKVQAKDVLVPQAKASSPSQSIEKKLYTSKTQSADQDLSGSRDPTPLYAHFLSESVSDGSHMSTSQRFVQTWKLHNPGPQAWPAGCSVRYVGGDNMFNIDNSHPFSAQDIANATESNVLKEEVKMGEEFAFNVLMKAPEREGTAISYWRLKTPDGQAFGHKLWCHIHVTRDPIVPTSVDMPREESKEKPSVVSDNKKDVLSSQMIFPTLEKESPQNSVHEAQSNPSSTESIAGSSTANVGVPVAETVPETSASPSAPAPKVESEADAELFDDAESIEIADSDSWDEDDGFVTDEEWDVLGASDEE